MPFALLSSPQSAIRARFAATISRPEPDIDLAEAALLIAAEEYPDLDIGVHLRRLDALALEARSRIGDVPLDASGELVRRFHAYLFGELGFRGNEQDYHDPRNSFLNDVLERRTGIPISLATVYLEVARRLGAPVRGVGFPGHFLTRWDLGSDGRIMVDPFHGAIVSEEDCRKLLERLSSGQLTFRPDMLEALPTKGMLARMLFNLKGVWIKKGDFERAIGATDRILLLMPGAASEIRDRGLLWLKLECFGPALADLEAYLKIAPNASDAGAVADQLVPLRQLVARLA